MKRSEFKKRMQSLKSYREQNPDKGYWDWRASLPDNLRYTDDTEYDMRGAYKSKSDFVRDYNAVPLTDTGTNQNLV